MTLELFISLAGTVVSLIVTTITFFAKYLKNKKAKAIAENVVEIGNAILPLISQAEKLVNYTGEEKKEYVMTLIRQYAFNKQLTFDYQQVSDKVDELVALTKEVNVKEKPKDEKMFTNETSVTTSDSRVVNQIL